MFERDWKERWIDEMGLIVALSGEVRFSTLASFKNRMRTLPQADQESLRIALKQRFTPSSYSTNNPSFNGCREGTVSVESAIEQG